MAHAALGYSPTYNVLYLQDETVCFQCCNQLQAAQTKHYLVMQNEFTSYPKLYPQADILGMYDNAFQPAEK